MLVDVNRLRGKIAENGMNISRISEKLNINRNTFASYLARPGAMPYDIISKLISVLRLSQSEATSIFLPGPYVNESFENVYDREGTVEPTKEERSDAINRHQTLPT